MKFELDWLKKWNLYSPNAVAMVDGDTLRSLTYSELFQLSQRMAFCLHSVFHVRKGDRVALLSQNQLEIFALHFACQRLGATLVPMNYRLAAPEIEFLLKDSQPSLLVYEKDFLNLLSNTSEFPKLQSVVLSGESLALTEQSLKKTDLYSDFASSEEDLALILYTSGTTGFPKGAMLSHRMLHWNSLNTTLRLNVQSSDAAVIFLPLFHTGGWNVLSTPFLHRGAKIILTKKFDGDQILSLTEKFGCSLIFGVPTTMDMMARSPKFQTANLKSVRYAIVGGEPMPLELIDLWHSKGVPVRQGYGLTEFGPNVFSLNEEHAKSKQGSVGFPNFYIETKVCDDSGQPVPANEIGELWLRGPSSMTGYFDNPKSTQDTLTADGWLKTGDLVRQDSEGFFFIVGRKKEMYKSGGENVYPAEVERVIQKIQGVREVAVIGIPDPKWGEVGKAFIALEHSMQLSEDEVVNYCQQHLAKFKVPKQVQFLSSLPKTDSGKIQKSKLNLPV
ncbi:MAG: acyl-CoA synthetase [Pseudobdellovibrionaceae bacterium]